MAIDGSRFQPLVDRMIRSNVEAIWSLWDATVRSGGEKVPATESAASSTSAPASASTETKVQGQVQTASSSPSSSDESATIKECDVVVFWQLKDSCDPVGFTWAEYDKTFSATPSSPVRSSLRQFANEGDIPIATVICLGGATKIVFPSACLARRADGS